METLPEIRRHAEPDTFRNFLRGMETEMIQEYLGGPACFRNFLRGMETSLQFHQFVPSHRPSETSLEGWKPMTVGEYCVAYDASETSLEGWKPVRVANSAVSASASETSLEGWKREPVPRLQERVRSFRNFLRGMETYPAAPPE